jgi:hypothetical protein
MLAHIWKILHVVPIWYAARLCDNTQVMSLLFGRRGVGVVRLATRTTTTVPLAAVQGSDAHGLFPGASQTAAAHTGITICSSYRHTNTSAGLHPSSNPSGLFRAGPRLEAYPRSNHPMNTSRRVVRSASTSGTERLTEFDHEAFSSAFLQEVRSSSDPQPTELGIS